ncbi:MAG: putative quinol monooxygenase [Pseudomonadales bacterium]|jgi:quinol monooxygenase YgiN|nr:antibiotic biosynthesis monooxygenase [Pseudomonadales bacterium]
MIYNNVILEVIKEADIDTVRALLRRQGELSRQEPGCSRFEVYQSQTEQSLFMLIEQWETLAHLEAHREATAFKEIYEPRILPRVERVPHPSDLVFP